MRWSGWAAAALAACGHGDLVGDDARALTGGTLARLPDGGVVLSDPDGDRLLVVQRGDEALAVTAEGALPPGSRPGRLAVDGEGAVWATLRGLDGVARWVPGRAPRVTQAVCAGVRGVDTIDDGAWVACADGALVRLDRRGDVVDRVVVADDLRDVVVFPDRLVVSRARAAEVITLNASGDVVATSRPPAVAAAAGELAPGFAWRLAADGDGVVLVHQRVVAGPVALEAGFGAPPYGGAGCDAVVQTGVTRFGADGQVAWTSPPLLKLVLPVDVAPDGDGAWVVAAGAAGISDVAVGRVPYGLADGCWLAPGPSWSGVTLEHGGRVVAAAPDGDGVWIQTQAPLSVVWTAPGQGTERLALGDAAADDRGFALFHAAPTGTVACASCHPEGAEDGRTWPFLRGDVAQPRRTQSLAGGVAVATPPLHWEGEHADLAALLDDVLVGRMGGAYDDDDVASLAAFLARTPAPRPVVVGDAAARGAVVFEAAGCGACHAGPWLTDGLAHDVGTLDPGGRPVVMATPSLVGLGSRGPWMHDGCAATLERRFETACGGTDHGAVAPGDVPDLVAFLRSR